MKNKVLDIAFFVSIPILVLLVFRYLYQFDGLYGQDPYAYLEQSYSIFKFDQKWFQASFYPFLGNVFSFGIFQKAWVLQIISALSISFSAYFLFKIFQKEFNSKKYRSMVLLFFILSPFVFRSSLVVMSDALAVLGITLTLYQLTQKSKQSVFLLLLIAALTLTTRYAVLPILFVMVAYKSIIAIRKKHFLPLFLGGLVFVSILFIALTYLTSTDGGIGHGAISEWSPRNFLRRYYSSKIGSLSYYIPNFINVFKVFWSPGMVWISLLVVFHWKAFVYRVKNNKTVVVSILLYLVFLAGLTTQNDRFLLPVIPLVLYLVVPVVYDLIQTKFTSQTRVFGGISLGVLMLAMSLYATKPFLAINKTEQKLASYINGYGMGTIYSLGLTKALKARHVVSNFEELWEEDKLIFKTHSFLIIDTLNLYDHWIGSVPFKNWQTVNRYYKLRNIDQIDNYTIYRIGKKE